MVRALLKFYRTDNCSLTLREGLKHGKGPKNIGALETDVNRKEWCGIVNVD